MNATQSKSLGFLAVIGALSLLTACNSAPKSWSETNVAKRNKVELVRLTQDVDFADAGPAAKALPEASVKALDAFLRKNKVGHGDELSLDLPLGKDSDAEQANLMHRKALAAYLATQGLTLAATVTPYGAEPRPGTVRLVVGRYIVTPPACPDWSKPAGADYQNTPSSNLGCATESVLGQMVANPRDLIQGQDSGPADGATGAKAVQSYYAGSSSTPAAASPATATPAASSASAGMAASGN